MAIRGCCFGVVFWVVAFLGLGPSKASLHRFFDTTYSDYYPKITTSPMSTCDEHQLKDICFWKNMSYLINPGNKRKRIGTIGPPRDPDLCNVRNIKYDVIRGLDLVKLYPPDSESTFWTIGLKQNIASQFQADIKCILSSEYTKVSFMKTIDIESELGCTVPVPQEAESFIKLDGKKIMKGDTFAITLFIDKSFKGVNTYKPFIVDKAISDFLSPKIVVFQDNREGQNRTVIHYTLTATKTKTLKNDMSFKALLNSTNENCAHATGFSNVTIKCGIKRIKRSYIFNNNSKILRTAATHARVTQPHVPSPSMSNFKCTATNVKKNPFNITYEGIIYVEDSVAVRESPVNVITLNVTWTKNNVLQSEELEVKLVNETVPTCDTVEMNGWDPCASRETAKSCEKRSFCGQGTGGSNSVQTRTQKRCTWRGDDRIISSETVFYHTCTPDPTYCPDNQCDSLEVLDEEYICPQDCSQRIMFPSLVNPKTGRGVEECDGVLVCHQGCSCNPTKNETKKANVKQGLVRTNDKKDDELNPNNYCDTDCILFACGGVSLIIFALVSFVVWRLERTKKILKGKYMDNLPEVETPFSDYVDRNVASEPLVLNFQMSSSLDNDSPNCGVRNMKVDTKWKFPRHQLFIEQVLGEGEFGKVLKAKAFNIAGRPGYSLVAVKTLKDDARKQDYNDLFSEYQLLKEVHHPHVIQLLGVCTEDGPLYVIIEYAIFGSLRNHLRRSRHIITVSDVGDIEGNAHHKVTPRDILSFARQIASGMSYLSDIKLVHRDLAARNILLAENKVCKISDFGLTRDIYEDNAYFKKSKGRVPVKWMASESLADHVYTTKSDVWSFGVLIWELVTLGASPYPGIPVHNLYNLLKQGYRMERPPNCSAALYSVMSRCWNSSPEDRPSFLELYHCFDNLLTDNVNYLDLSDNSIINKSYFTNFSIEQDTDSSSDVITEQQVNFLKNDVKKSNMSDEKLLNTDNMKESFVGYETPVKNPRPVIVAKVDDPYTDMNAKT